MSEINEMLRETSSRLFGDLCNRSVLDKAEEGYWPDALWHAANAAGLCSALNPESDVAEPLPLDTLATIAQTAGEFAVPLPIPETMLAQSTFIDAGLTFPAGPMSIALDEGCGHLSRKDGVWLFSGVLRRVPWGRNVHAIAVVSESAEGFRVIRLQPPDPAVRGINLANEPRDDFELTCVELADDMVSPPIYDTEFLRVKAALFRCAQMCGAMQRCLDMSVQYAMERVQFGKPIGKFQAVQHMVAILAGEVASAAAATQAAVHAATERSTVFEVYAAKARVSEAAGICQALAHQIHAAMGTTHEHSLHVYTRRLMSWRDEYGTEAECAEWIGRYVQTLGGPNLWSLVTTPAFRDVEIGTSHIEELHA